MTMTLGSYYVDNASTADSADISGKNDSREPVANRSKNRGNQFTTTLSKRPDEGL